MSNDFALSETHKAFRFSGTSGEFQGNNFKRMDRERLERKMALDRYNIKNFKSEIEI